MGVKNLIKFIEKYAPTAITYKNIEAYRDTCIGFDADLLLYKIIFGIRVRGYDIKNGDQIVTHIHGVLLKFLGFLKYQITPVFVFDTKMPEIKYSTIRKRREMKDRMIKKYEKSKSKEGKRIHYYVSTDITHNEMEDYKKLIQMFGYNMIHAKEEADSQLVSLYKNRVIDYIASDDMDILMFSGKLLLKNFTVNPKKYIQEIDLSVCLISAGITMDQFIRIGLLHGTDYCDTGSTSSIKAYVSVCENMDEIKRKCKKAYDYFVDAPAHQILPHDLAPDNRINKKMLKQFLLDTKFKDQYIKKLWSDIKKYRVTTRVTASTQRSVIKQPDD